VTGEVLGASAGRLWLTVVSTVAILVAVVAVVRVVGLRSFAKMSSFDFAVTVAVGSLVASVALTSASLALGVVAVSTLLATQWLISRLRLSSAFGGAVDNTPTVLVAHGRFVAEHLRRTRVTELDIRAKLRQANVVRLSDVAAVVLETTGDFSIIHGHDAVAPEMLQGVVGAELVLRDGADPGAAPSG
jgi:uncharacterized membrane protein YcaP (DUF421 family)